MRTAIYKELNEVFDQTGLTLNDLIPGITIEEVIETMDQTGLTLEQLVEMNR